MPLREITRGSSALSGSFASLALAVAAALPGAVHAQQSTSGDQRLEEILVTSSRIAQPRRQIATAVSVIDQSEMELRGYFDLSDALRTQTGIGVSNSGGPGKATTLRIRGEEGFRTVLMIDGVKAVDPSAPQVAPGFDSLLTTSDLQRVEILRGPQGFIYGADAGGVVNVMTKRGAGPVGGQLGLEYGEFSTRRIDGALSGGSDAGDYYFSVTDLETDGFNARSDDTVLRDDDGASNTTFHTKLGWNATENLRLQLVAREIDAETAYDNCFPGNDCTATTDQTTYRLSAEHTSGALSNTFAYSNVDIVRDNFNAGVSTFATEGQLARIEYTGTFKPSAALALVYGLDFQDEELVDSGGSRTLSRDQKGYYVEYQGAFADESFFLSLGARHDDNEQFGSFTSTRLTAAYVQDLDSNRSIKYRASVGTGFRAPSLYEIAYNAGSFAFPPASETVLREENSRGYDIGVEYDTANGLHFEVTYFDQEIEDAIEFDQAMWSGYLQLPGTSTSKGIEIAANVPLGERWELLANWTNNDAETAAGIQRLRRPKNLGNFGVAYRSANDRFRFIANYRLSKDAIDINPAGAGNAPIPDYEVLDLSASYGLTENLEVYGRIQNATDETYQEVLNYNTAGRSVYGGVRLRF